MILPLPPPSKKTPNPQLFPWEGGSHPIFQHADLTGCQVVLLLVRNKFPGAIEMQDESHRFFSSLPIQIPFTGVIYRLLTKLKHPS